MKKNIYFRSIIVLCGLASLNICFAKPVDLTEPMKESMVYLDISISSFNQAQPWKQNPISKDSGYGCAVGPYEVLTTAENIRDASLLRAKRYGKSAYIPAKVKIVDYELNLCLLELDKDAMDSPLTPLSFTEAYPKGNQLSIYWLSASDHLTTAHSTLDRAEMQVSGISFIKNLTFFATNVSRPFGDGEICCDEKDVIGMSHWGSDSDSGIIPSETINKFLTHCDSKSYSGFAAPGFKATTLLDPVQRGYLKMPDKIKHGIYISSVYTIGTGSSELKQADVILAVNGHTLNPYGQYEHPVYKRISYHHLLMQTPVGETMKFKVFRDGKITTLDVKAKGVESDKMLIPHYQYGKQPEYAVLGGFILQRLTRNYLSMRGGDWSGKVPPHLYSYYRDMSFKPSLERQHIVILSFVLPVEKNIGYQNLSGMVVDSVNGTKIASIGDITRVIDALDDSEDIEITFEMDSPTVIIPKKHLGITNMQVSQMYGIPQMRHIEK